MAQVHPYKFTTSILSLAQEKGAQLIHGRCTSLNSKSVSYTTESGTSDLPADTIIVTAGPWTASLLPSVPILTSRAHSIIIEPSSKLPPQGIFFSYESSDRRMEPELYSRPSSVYICGPTDRQHALPDYSHNVIALEKQISDLEAFAKQISTRLAEGKVVTKQACYLPIHARGFPAIGWTVSPRKGRAGVYVAAGHAVWGISLAPGTGKIVAEMVVGGNTGKGDDWDVTKLAP
jgi:glycine/D-amino acid oxidase-like deaminating enzyme